MTTNAVFRYHREKDSCFFFAPGKQKLLPNIHKCKIFSSPIPVKKHNKIIVRTKKTQACGVSDCNVTKKKRVKKKKIKNKKAEITSLNASKPRMPKPKTEMTSREAFSFLAQPRGLTRLEEISRLSSRNLENIQIPLYNSCILPA